VITSAATGQKIAREAVLVAALGAEPAALALTVIESLSVSRDGIDGF